MECVTDLDHPPVIGLHYRVPCIYRDGKWRPIIGPRHNDLEINFPFFHYHPDPRFIPYSDLRFVDGIRFTAEQQELGNVIHSSEQAEIKLKRKRCIRAMPEFPDSGITNPPALPIVETLESIYLGRKALCGLCPHKKLPLGALPRLADGSIICSGHGLRISKGMEVIVR